MPAKEPYREGGASATGLPFPRKGMGLWIGSVVAVAIAAMFVPLALVASLTSRVVSAIQDGGPGMLVLLLLQLGCPGVIAVLGALAIRGRKIPTAALPPMALVPALVAFAATLYSHTKVDGAVSAESVAPLDKVRIAYEGLAESDWTLLYGALICAFALGAAATAAVGIAATVDRERVGAKGGLSWLVSLVVSLAWIVASLAYVLFTKALGSGAVIFLASLVASALVALLAMRAAQAASSLRGWHDPKEATRIAGAILVAALASELMIVLFDRAIVLAVERQAFSVVSGEGLDPSQRARVLFEWLSTSRTYPFLAAIHVVGVLGSFAPALVRASGGGTTPFEKNAVVVSGLVIATALGFTFVSARQYAYIRSVAALTRAPDEPVTLPKVGDLRSGVVASSVAVVVRADAKGPPVVAAPGRATLAADKDVTVATLIAAVTLVPSSDDTTRFGRPESSIEFLVEPSDERKAAIARLDPDLASMLSAARPVVTAVVDWKADNVAKRPSILIGADGKLTVTPPYKGAEAVLTLGPDFPERLRDVAQMRTYGTDFYVIAQMMTTVDTIAQVLGAIQRDEYHRVYLSAARP